MLAGIIRFERSIYLSTRSTCWISASCQSAVRVARANRRFIQADLLKLYLYGYLNRVRSTRRLAREAGCNVEVMWLLRNLRPGYRTIGDFRKDNRNALKAVNREFVTMMRELELLGGERVAVDGAFFHGDASKGSIVTAKRLEEQLAAVERDIEAYDAELDANDATETSAGQPEEPSGEDVAGKLATLLEKRAEAKADLAKMSRQRRDAGVAHRCGCPAPVEERSSGRWL